MSNRLLLICLIAWLAPILPCIVKADEILIGARQDSASDTREIRAGELWQIFHDRGVTSVDTIKLNLQSPSLFNDLSGTMRFQIEDPSSGVISNRMTFDPSASQVEIPLDFDLMSRYTPDSQEMIKLDFSGLKSMRQDTSITLDAGTERVRSINFLFLVSFILFWLAVFFFLYRLTKPTENVIIEDIVLRSSGESDANIELSESETIAELNKSQTQNYPRIVAPLRASGQSSTAGAR